MTSESASSARSLLLDTTDNLRLSWKQLALTGVVFKIVAIVVLTPLVGLLFRVLIAISGSSVLSDADLLFFFLRPIGWLCCIIVGSLWLAIIALEQAALLGIIGAEAADPRIGVLGALRFAISNAWPVLQVTARIVAFSLLVVAPFLAVAAATYFLLLNQYDINYYLKEKPPEFLVAAGLGGVILAALVGVLLRFFAGWFFALPLVLFENVSPSHALRLSQERLLGQRRSVLVWIVGWFLATTVLTTAATGVVGVLGRLLIPDATTSLRVLEFAIGMTLLLWSIANLAVNLLSTTTFAAILFRLYRQLGYRQLGSDGVVAPQLESADVAADKAGFHITPARVVGAASIGLVVAFASGVVALQSVRLDDDVQIMAHRGSSQVAPENTMAAFRQAIEEGADWIELDVQETADGKVVVLHDSDFMKLAHKKLKIWDATMDDLKDIDIGSWFSAEYKTERVPTLAEVLDECKGKIRVNIELKYYGHEKQLEQRVVDLVESRDMSEEVVAMSLKMDGVRKLKSLRPAWKVGLLMSVAAGNLRKFDADFLAVNAKFASRAFVRTAHNNGKEVYVWTVNDALTMSTMISRGVDGLLTDKPALARAVLEQRAQMSGPERLLLELAGILGAAPEIREQ